MPGLDSEQRMYVCLTGSAYKAEARAEYDVERNEVSLSLPNGAYLVFGMQAARCVHDALAEVLRLDVRHAEDDVDVVHVDRLIV